MSSGFAMVALRRRRGTFIVLTVACVAAFFAVGVFGAKALEQSRIDAQATAKGLATAGVASVLETSDTEAVIEGGQGRDLLDRLQRGVLADGTVFRIRVWSPEGDLLFSTDAADQPGELLGDFPSIAVATTGGGKPVSVLSADGEVYQTYVPLRLGGPDALGAVQVDQGYQPIAQRVASAVVAAPDGRDRRSDPVPVAGDRGDACRSACPATAGSSRPDADALPRPRPVTAVRRRGATASMKELARAETRAEDAETKRDELERQIGQLRTQVSSADENAGRKIAELEAALEEARVGKAVAEAAPANDPAAEARVRELEQQAREERERADQARSRVHDLEAKVGELEAAKAAAPSADAAAAVDAHELVALRTELAQANDRAAEGGAQSRRHRAEAPGVRGPGDGARDCGGQRPCAGVAGQREARCRPSRSRERRGRRRTTPRRSATPRNVPVPPRSSWRISRRDSGRSRRRIRTPRR